jgi:hypothetical protein
MLMVSLKGRAPVIRRRSRSRFGARPHFGNIRHATGLLAALSGFLFGVLALFVVPAPHADTALEVSGALVSISRPQPAYGDMGIVLDNEQSYYVNRAMAVGHFAWKQMLSDVSPGEQVHLTVVSPLAWRLMGTEDTKHLPVAGIRTSEAVYMDPTISAELWTAQSRFSLISRISLLLFAMCYSPDLTRWFKHHRPPTSLGAQRTRS